MTLKPEKLLNILEALRACIDIKEEKELYVVMNDAVERLRLILTRKCIK